MEKKAVINASRLVMQSVMGEIHHPLAGQPYRLDDLGRGRALPAAGGICYNVKVGDSVYAFECDHVELGVSIQNPDKVANAALNTLAYAFCYSQATPTATASDSSSQAYRCFPTFRVNASATSCLLARPLPASSFLTDAGASS